MTPPSAAEHTIRHNRKTVAPADVLAGLDDAELDALLKHRVQAELAVYTSAQTAKRNEYRRKQKASTEGGPSGDPSPGGAAGAAASGAPAEEADREALMGGDVAMAGEEDERGIQAQLAAEMGGRHDGPREEKRRRTAGGEAFPVGGPETEEGEDVEDPERYGAEEEDEEGDEEVGDDVDEDEEGPVEQGRDDEDEMARLENEHVRPDEEGDSTEEDEDMQ